MNRNTKKTAPAAAGGIDGKQLIEAVKALSKEKDISEDVLFSAIEEAMKTAYRRNLPKGAVEPTNLSATIDRKTGEVHVYARLLVSDDEEEVSPNKMHLSDAKRLQSAAQLNDIIEIDVTPKGFLRVAAQSAKQVLMQRIREAERGRVADEYADKKDEIITAVVIRQDERGAYVELGHTQGFLEKDNMIPGEVLKEGDHIKVYVMSVQLNVGKGGTQIEVTRIVPALVRRLFEMEVPEIQTGEVVIKNVAREAGSRSKISVYSANPNVDPVGACVGQRGGRVERVVEELRGEKVDIIKWSENPAEYVGNALNPAHVIDVYALDNEKTCRVVVPDNQLSLAIGKEGQNARLAAKLTGWKIDIKSESQAAEMTDMVDDQGIIDPLVKPMARMEYDPTVMESDDDTL